MIRHVFSQFRSGAFNAAQAREQLELSKTRFYELYSDYFRACAQRRQQDWIPGLSGGDHTAAWPDKVTALLRKRLSSRRS